MSDTSLKLPRILCLHGKLGVGSNADVLFLQTRTLRSQLDTTFRFVFANGPFFCEPGPGMLPAYGGAEPFRRWLRWSSKHRVLKPKSHLEALRKCIEDAMDDDDQAGATGAWVGLLGFSQGARLAASILFESQRREIVKQNGGTTMGYEGENVKTKLWSQKWQFAVLFSGPSPLVAMSPGLGDLPLQSPEELDLTTEELDKFDPTGKICIERPTLHVIGRGDEWAPSQRRLYDKYCSEASRNLVEWDGEHRIPIEPSLTKNICEMILGIAGKTAGGQ
ncbi:serine hydrolase FSH [Clohesyomyces aquaticus]|uniref:Serine hydrolase FSH n=1 Tax=Clohesyomyces aquaticus TaxID=1231657 RepID=A0A1Y1Z0L8_9PLEO|nr:serine hydrolase FSH [Clohesyomyces aquaticus]